MNIEMDKELNDKVNNAIMGIAESKSKEIDIKIGRAIINKYPELVQESLVSALTEVSEKIEKDQEDVYERAMKSAYGFPTWHEGYLASTMNSQEVIHFKINKLKDKK